MLETSSPAPWPRDPHPLLLLFRAPAILWVLLAGEALAAILSLAPGVAIWRWAYFGLMSLLIQWISLLTLGVLYLSRQLLVTLSPRIVAWLAVLALLLVSCALGTLGAIFVPRVWPTGSIEWTDVSLQLSAMMAVVGLLSALVFENHWRSRQLALRAKQAELATLQARIHPHFLFNTLNSAAALVHARPDDAERVLLDLGDLFRAALSEPGWVPVAHELDLCRRYLAIEQQRFGDRLQVEWRVDEGLERLSVPLLTIQPLVENAVAHGLEERSGVKSLRVEAMQTAAELVVSVRNAVPRDTAAVERNGHSVGLAGVRARVESVTQGTGSVATESDGASFVVRVVLPKAAMPPQDRTGAQ